MHVLKEISLYATPDSKADTEQGQIGPTLYYKCSKKYIYGRLLPKIMLAAIECTCIIEKRSKIRAVTTISQAKILYLVEYVSASMAKFILIVTPHPFKALSKKCYFCLEEWIGFSNCQRQYTKIVQILKGLKVLNDFQSQVDVWF